MKNSVWDTSGAFLEYSNKICSACKKFKFKKILKGKCDYRLWVTESTINEAGYIYICTCKRRDNVEDEIKHKVRLDYEM